MLLNEMFKNTSMHQIALSVDDKAVKYNSTSDVIVISIQDAEHFVSYFSDGDTVHKDQFVISNSRNYYTLGPMSQNNMIDVINRLLQDK